MKELSFYLSINKIIPLPYGDNVTLKNLFRVKMAAHQGESNKVQQIWQLKKLGEGG